MLVGRVANTLKRHLGRKSVFLDVDDIPAGVDFQEHIEHIIKACDTTIVLIGPRWNGPLADGSARIDDIDDRVRLEIEAALRVEGHQVIPLLIGKAEMPTASNLPKSISVLAKKNAYRLDPVKSYDEHISRVVRQLVGSAWFNRVYRRNMLLVASFSLAVGIGGIAATLKSSRSAGSQQRIRELAYNVIAPYIEDLEFRLSDMVRVLDTSKPRMMVKQVRERDQEDAVATSRYSRAWVRFDLMMRYAPRLVEMGWGSCERQRLNDLHLGLKHGFHGTLKDGLNPHIVQTCWDLKRELQSRWGRNDPTWSGRDSLAWDRKLDRAQGAYEAVVPACINEARHYMAQLLAVRDMLKP